MKLNVLLARAEHTGKQFKALLEEYLATFKSKHSIFQGVRKEYEAAPNQEDVPQMRGTRHVQSTVLEYLDYFEKTCAEFINHRFSIEATNSTGPKAELIVEEQTLGKFSTTELLRLNDFLNGAELLKMYHNLPVRSDTVTWKETNNPEFTKRGGIFETEERKAPNKTTIKSSRILADPNLVHLKGNQNYIPQVVPDDTNLILGTLTEQIYSGELSHRDRADILRRLTLLKASVKEALVKANEADVVESQLTANKLFGYLHRGTFLTKP